MLIRSTRENVKHYLPFLEKMTPIVQANDLADLVTLNQFRTFYGKPNKQYFNQDDAPVKDETTKEEQLQTLLDNRKK